MLELKLLSKNKANFESTYIRPTQNSKDGDCVCFGARRVYRTFSSENDAEIELLEMAKVDAKFNRFDFIACAILLGCDFFPGTNFFDLKKNQK